MSEERDERSGLSRWSERKSAHRRGERPVEQPEVAASDNLPDDGEQAARAAELEANRAAAEEVDLATLDETSDFTVFMKDGVPSLLRKQALAILWRSSPVFAHIDGLIDYDDDFGSPDLIMKTFQSAWQSGRGYETPAEENAEASEAASEEIEERPNVEEDEAETESGDEAAETGEPEAMQASEAEEQHVESTAKPEDCGEAAPAETGGNERPRVSLRRRLRLIDEEEA